VGSRGFEPLIRTSSGFLLSPATKLNTARTLDIETRLREFARFLSVKKLLTDSVVIRHCNTIRGFLYEYDGIVSPNTIEAYLSEIKNTRVLKTYANHLCSMKRFVRDYLGLDWMDDYEFPDIPEKPLIVPSKKDIQRFFYALPICRRDENNVWGREEIEPKFQATYLMLATSGLRLDEVLSLTLNNVYPRERMVIPYGVHVQDSTKKAWITFYNIETEQRLTWLDEVRKGDRIFVGRNVLYRAFNKARETTGLDITPQKLRDWFCEEMGNLGVSDRYIDAFCGRVPKSVLAKHYTDYSPKKLKAIYDKADLRVLG